MTDKVAEVVPASAGTVKSKIAGNLGTLIATVGVLYCVWAFVAPVIKHAGAGENNLEKALHLGVSTRTQWQTFVDNGGLNNSEQGLWRGMNVTNASGVWNDDGTINTIDLTLGVNGGDKVASPNNIKDALSDVCKGAWMQTGHAYSSMTMDSGMQTDCIISVNDSNGSTEIVLTKGKPQ